MSSDDRNELVCYCMSVDRGTVRAAIAQGAITIYDLQDTTFACTGCGTCREDLLAMIEAAGATPDPETATGKASSDSPSPISREPDSGSNS